VNDSERDVALHSAASCSGNGPIVSISTIAHYLSLSQRSAAVVEIGLYSKGERLSVIFSFTLVGHKTSQFCDVTP